MAARTLEAAGLRILERNWRCSYPSLKGEVDLVAEESAIDYAHGGEVVAWRVIVEVRTRRGDAQGTALQSVDQRKAAQLRALGAAWVQVHAWRGPWRIDVVAVQMDSFGRLLAVEHIRSAVTGG
jgi:putative endonuclease